MKIQWSWLLEWDSRRKGNKSGRHAGKVRREVRGAKWNDKAGLNFTWKVKQVIFIFDGRIPSDTLITNIILNIPTLLEFLFLFHFFVRDLCIDLKNLYCYSITVVCLFSPSLHPTPDEPTSLPHLHPPPWFCPYVSFIVVPVIPSPYCPLPTAPWLLSDCS